MKEYGDPTIPPLPDYGEMYRYAEGLRIRLLFTTVALVCCVAGLVVQLVCGPMC